MPELTARPTDPLQESAQFVKGVGPARFELVKRLGLETVGDLLFFFPRAYEDLSDCRKIADLTEGTLQTVAGEVVEIEGRETRTGKELLSIVISDGSGVVEGAWFNQTFMARKFRFGQRVTFSGKPQWYRDHWQINNPRVQLLGDESFDPSVGGRVLPVYPLTEGLHIEQMRRIQRHVAETYARHVPELLPEKLLQQHQYPTAPQAVQAMHLPATLPEATQARRRLVYEEFLILQIGLALRRRDIRETRQAPVLPITRKIDEHIRRLFPFQLTRDQNRAVVQICKDMGSPKPMQRLLQADVGAGKTAVAVYALLLAVAHQCQAAIMAPTEVLARQHWRTLSAYLANSRVRKSLLTGGLKPRDRKSLLGEIRMGQVDLVVGTQALIQEDVEFAKLGLVVIDEQHRFGVAQRERFRRMGEDPHYLVMTATPIPRTMALTIFGDLDVSIMREQPPGRLPTVTKAVTEERRPKLMEHLIKQLRKGRQLYVVCPLVDESANTDIKAAEQTFKELQEGAFQDYKVGLLHGRMDESAKDSVMTRFRDGDVQVLVSTTVIEVGVDVPNATLMVIEHADRFGLSQLHQLRGRVSRGPVAGECYLFAPTANEESKDRIRTFTRTRDGFALAEEDAKERGLGQFFGTRQHGLGELRLGSVMSDGDILELARKDAFAVVAADPKLVQVEHAGLRRAVLDRYGTSLELAEIG
jgi:ATP-dependent DNA helicase RecG